mmetsp:Transcript_3776/g.5291  ORF Transcript_3776/g.5291 Transcript_3776/m.5291 type:complete len:95 (-) Transcript_3776:19-303(-)
MHSFLLKKKKCLLSGIQTLIFRIHSYSVILIACKAVLITKTYRMNSNLKNLPSTKSQTNPESTRLTNHWLTFQVPFETNALILAQLEISQQQSC